MRVSVIYALKGANLNGASMSDLRLNYTRDRLGKVCDALRRQQTFDSHRVGKWFDGEVRTGWLYSPDYPEHDKENGEVFYALLCRCWRKAAFDIKALAAMIPCDPPPGEIGSAARWVIMVVPRVAGDTEIMRQDAIAQGRCTPPDHIADTGKMV